MGRRVLEENDARRQLHAELGHRLDDLENRALSGQVDRVVAFARLDIFEPTESIEVVFFIVVERGLVTEPAERRIRIGVDLEVEGVVVQLAFGLVVHVLSVRCTHLPGPFGNFNSDPASTRICWPVMYRDSSLAKKSARLAMSSGS